MGLVSSGKADMIFTSDISFAVAKLFDNDHRARILALFRNPVDRCVSKFYYLQTATWERTYQPEWADLSVMEWAERYNDDENFMVKKMAMKGLRDPVDMTDLVIAKEIVRRYFIVGLMNDMEESFRRFNIFLGLDETYEQKQMCMNTYLGSAHDIPVDVVMGDSHAVPAAEVNSNPHPKVNNIMYFQVYMHPILFPHPVLTAMLTNLHSQVLEGSPEYNLLAERNALDMMLYDYITRLYEDQASLVNSYVSGAIT